MRHRDYVGVVMAAGAGSRLAQTYSPKVMAPVGQERVIDHSIDALHLARATRVGVVTSDDTTAAYVSPRCRAVQIEPGTHVVFGVVESLLAFPDCDYFVWIDGDTVANPSDLSAIVLRAIEADSDLSGQIILSMLSNHGSQWTLTADARGRLREVRRARSPAARIAVGLTRTAAISAIDMLGGVAAVKRNRRQSALFDGYEGYLCGWGLLFHLLATINASVLVRVADFRFVNVNTPADLTLARCLLKEVGLTSDTPMPGSD